MDNMGIAVAFPDNLRPARLRRFFSQAELARRSGAQAYR
jgi:hypothetical protein